MRFLRVAAAFALVLAACDKKGGDAAGPPPDKRGAPPPSSPSASADAAKATACRDGGGTDKDAVSAPFFPRQSGGYCVNPDGETKAYGDKAPKPISGICDLFDGGCELYKSNGVKRLVQLDYVDGDGKGGQIDANLSQYADAEHAYAMFTHRVTSDEDPARTDMPKAIDVGAGAAAIGTGALYAWKGTYLLELSYSNSAESGDDKKLRASGEKALPPLAKDIVAKLPGDAALPLAVQKLPVDKQIPLGTSWIVANALGTEGTGGGALGYYKDGDKRWRLLVIAKADADQARDVVKTFGKQKGATEEKALGEGGERLMVQEDKDGPKAEWIIARQGPLVMGIGDEPYAFSGNESAADHDKVCLSKDDKRAKLKSLLGGKLGSRTHMDFELDEHHKILQKTLRDFFEREAKPHARKWDEEERFPTEIVPKLAELGLLGIRIPEEYGGSGMSTLAYAIAVEEAARVDGSLALTIASHNGLGTGHILAFGSEAQKRKYLPKAAAGEWLAAWALTEPGSGSDSAGLATVATRDGAGWRITGTKMFITQGSVGGFCVVLARTNKEASKQKGITAFIVEHGTKGFSASKHLEKLGMRSSDTVELTLDDVYVDDAQRVGAVDMGFIDTMKILDRGRISIAALSLGLGFGAIDMAVTYAKDRKQFGRPIADFQGVQWPLANSRMEMDAAKALTWRAAFLADQGRPFSREASMAKLYASEAASRACHRSLQIHGGYGYTREFAVERHLRDAKLCEIGEGTSEVQRMVIAKHLLAG